MSDVREVTSCVEALAVSSFGVISVSAVISVSSVEAVDAITGAVFVSGVRVSGVGVIPETGAIESICCG